MGPFKKVMIPPSLPGPLLVLSRSIHAISVILSALAFIPILFWVVAPASALLGGAAFLLLYRIERMGLLLEQRLITRAILFLGRSFFISLFLYGALLLHSWACYIRPLNNEIDPIRELYRAERRSLTPPEPR
jgi:hypothetical protein